MQRLIVLVLLFISTITLANDTLLRPSNFTADNAGTYVINKIEGVLDGQSVILVNTSGDIWCTTYNGEDLCSPIPELSYSLYIDSNGIINIDEGGSYTEDLQDYSVYDNIDNLDFIFTADSFSFYYNEDGVSGTITFLKTGAALPTEPLSISQETLETAASEQSAYIIDLESYIYGSTEMKNRLQTIKTELENSTTIESVEYTTSSYGLWVSYKAGFDGLIAVAPKENKSSVAAAAVLNSVDNPLTLKELLQLRIPEVIKDALAQQSAAPTFRSSSIIGNNRVLSISAQYFDWGDNDDVPLITSLLQSSGYDVTTKKYNSKNSGNIDDFKDWDQYGIILLSSHGEASSTKVAIHTNSTIAAANLSKYEDDLASKRLILWGDSYAITQEFVDEHNDQFPNSLVYLSICKGAYTDALANTFTSKGAASFISYDNYVGVAFVKNYGVQLFEDLLESGEDLSTAYHSDVKETDSDPAQMVLFGQENLSIQTSETTTGDVEVESTEEVIAQTLQSNTQNINGHFIHYDDGAFDWIYILPNAQGIYKLNGLDSAGNFQWSSNLAKDFDSVTINSDDGDGSITFGNALNLNDVSQIIENSTLAINGHFIHYDEGAYDWVFITANGKGIYKLNGIDENDNFSWGSDISSKFDSIDFVNDSKSIEFSF